MRRYPESDTLVRGVVATLIMLLAVVGWIWWRSFSQKREARQEAMPGCVAKLGSEAACETQFDQHHAECFTYNNKPAGKYSPREFSRDGYLECVVVGAEPWAAARRARKAERRRQDRADGVPLR